MDQGNLPDEELDYWLKVERSESLWKKKLLISLAVWLIVILAIIAIWQRF